MGSLLYVPQIGIQSATEACVLARNRTHSLTVHRKMLQLMELPGQGGAQRGGTFFLDGKTPAWALTSVPDLICSLQHLGFPLPSFPSLFCPQSFHTSSRGGQEENAQGMGVKRESCSPCPEAGAG